MIGRRVACAFLGSLLSCTMALAADPPKFTPNDELAAVKALVGPVHRGSAKWARTDEEVKGFIDKDENLQQLLLSETYADGATTKHVLVLGGHYTEDGVIDDGEAQPTDLSAAVYELKNGKWALSVKAVDFTSAGQHGAAPGASLRSIGASQRVVQIASGFWGQGRELESVRWFVPDASGFREVLRLAPRANDEGTGAKVHFSYEGTLTVDEQSGPDHFDMRFAAKGTYRNDAGKVITVPAAPLVLRWKDGAYAPVDQSAATTAFWKAAQQPF